MSFVDTQLHAVLMRALSGVPQHELRRRAAALSYRYRTEQIDDATPGISDALDALAYAVVRMPATVSALDAALAAVERHVDGTVGTHLDLGGGTGAAAWAALARWPDLAGVEIVERRAAAVELGQQLAAGNSWRWTIADLRYWSPTAPVDLVTIGYVLNELTVDARAALIQTAARCARTIVVVEPGTPRGHRRILAVRELLIEHGVPDRGAVPARRSVSGRLVSLRDPPATHRAASRTEGRHTQLRGREVRVRRGNHLPCTPRGSPSDRTPGAPEESRHPRPVYVGR
jgi:ribosomal protein RSM22 (predicted rRNA methylase)